MKNLIFIIPALFLFNNANAQGNSRRTTLMTINGSDSSLMMEVFNRRLEIIPNPESSYFWYDNSTIRITLGTYKGKLLHGLYASFYPNNRIKEKGKLKKGLKKGDWISWYGNGKIKEYSQWSHGQLNGVQQFYDLKGRIITEKNFKKGLLMGAIYYSNEGINDSQKKNPDVEYSDETNSGMSPVRERR